MHIVDEILQGIIKVVGHPYLAAGASDVGRFFCPYRSRNVRYRPTIFCSDDDHLSFMGIWLSGHSLGHPNFFYNIWSQYTIIEPDKIDPTLGSEQDFKVLISSAHAHGIRVFIEVVAHGVMKDSPLVKARPDWFKGESWGMSDYDFEARNPELDQWWVDLWTNYILEYDLDGYRIDLGIRRPDLWKRIRGNIDTAGKKIVIINELEYEGTNEYTRQSGITDIAPIEEFVEVIDFVQRDR